MGLSGDALSVAVLAESLAAGTDAEIDALPLSAPQSPSTQVFADELGKGETWGLSSKQAARSVAARVMNKTTRVIRKKE